MKSKSSCFYVNSITSSFSLSNDAHDSHAHTFMFDTALGIALDDTARHTF